MQPFGRGWSVKPRTSDETRARISKSQRARYEREREAERFLRSELVRFALWLSPTWDEEYEDDVIAATSAVDEFIDGGGAK
jgi:hypothetical protein